ncbi:hypothetical protein OHB12_31235 [Nocardia sp. NBC_01730]|uniref:hypothetical protein n=1 Tax=Nocardia sp. NBC_01730 TaxID=2975998 RepID=UPI002E129C77|nr:hypothetical protein OHB12_31235 [Nocardia sp. NBC_01730]
MNIGDLMDVTAHDVVEVGLEELCTAPGIDPANSFGISAAGGDRYIVSAAQIRRSGPQPSAFGECRIDESLGCAEYFALRQREEFQGLRAAG